MTKYTEWKEYQFRINLENEKLKRRESLKTGMTKCSKIYNTQNVNIKEPSRLSKAVTYLFSIDNVITSKYSRTNEWEPQKFCTPLMVFMFIFTIFSGFLWTLRSLIFPHHLAEFHIVSNNSKCLVFSKLINNRTHIPYENMSFTVQNGLDSTCSGFVINKYECSERGFLVDFESFEMDENIGLFGQRFTFSYDYFEWSGWDWVGQPGNSSCSIWAIEHDSKINFKTTQIEQTALRPQNRPIWHMIPAESWEFITKFDIQSTVTAIFDKDRCMKLLPMKRYEYLTMDTEYFTETSKISCTKATAFLGLCSVSNCLKFCARS